MSSTLRKGIAFGEDGSRKPITGNSPQSLYYTPDGGASYTILNGISDSGTRWVRIWAYLTDLWPRQDYVDPALLESLDYQLALAKAYGCKTILVINQQLPAWLNQSVDTGALPANTDLTGPWCSMLNAFAARYSANTPNKPYSNLSQVDVLEFVNEPNLFGSDPAGNDLYGKVAVMFKRAKQISAQLNFAPLVAGPATADGDPYQTTPSYGGNRNYYDFTRLVLERLAGNGFYDVKAANGASADAACLWTHHNYTDLTYNQGSNTNAPSAGRAPYNTAPPQFARNKTRTQTTIELLQNGGWRGFPIGSVSTPTLFVTEGGVQRQKAATEFGFDVNDAASYEFFQSILMNANYSRMNNDGEGRGVEMLMNYLFINADNYTLDTGLFRSPGQGLGARPAYSTYKAFPSRQ